MAEVFIRTLWLAHALNSLKYLFQILGVSYGQVDFYFSSPSEMV